MEFWNYRDVLVGQNPNSDGAFQGITNQGRKYTITPGEWLSQWMGEQMVVVSVVAEALFGVWS